MSNKTSKYILIAITIFILLLSCNRGDRITNSSKYITWEKTIGNNGDDVGRSVISTPDGRCLVVGYTTTYGMGNYDVYVQKFNLNREAVWTKTYGSEDAEFGLCAAITTDQGYLIAGRKDHGNNGGLDVYLAKIDSTGDTLWTKNIGRNGDDFATSITPASDCGFVMAGITYSDESKINVYILKINPLGDTIWTRSFGGDADEYASAVATANDGGYFITGRYSPTDSYNPQVFLIKTDSAGDMLWIKYFGGDDSDGGGSIIPMLDGGCIIAGTTLSFGAGKEDIYLIRVDSAGGIIWTRTFGDGGQDFAHAITSLADGNFVVAGYGESYGGGDKNAILLKVDINGKLIWVRSYGSFGSFEVAESVTQTVDGGFVITGYRFLSPPNDIYIVKTDPDGNL